MNTRLLAKLGESAFAPKLILSHLGLIGAIGAVYAAVFVSFPHFMRAL